MNLNHLKKLKIENHLPIFLINHPASICVQVDPRSFLINLARDEKSRQAGGEDQQIIWENLSYIFFLQCST